MKYFKKTSLLSIAVLVCSLLFAFKSINKNEAQLSNLNNFKQISSTLKGNEEISASIAIVLNAEQQRAINNAFRDQTVAQVLQRLQRARAGVSAAQMQNNNFSSIELMKEAKLARL